MKNERMGTMPSKKVTLFCPGPVHVAHNVRSAVAHIDHEIGHREEEFSVLFNSLSAKLLALFGQKNDRAYTPVIVTGSGTAANETMLSSVVGTRRILVLTNGEFGERLHEISKLHNPHTETLNFGWANPIDLNELEAYLARNEVDIIAMTHHETSTGMLNPIKEIGALCKSHGMLFLVDTVSSSGAEVIDIAACNIGFCTGSSSKAIGSLPGLSFVVGKNEEFERLATIPPRTSYLNLFKFYTYAKTHRQTPNTPAVQLFFAFEQALDNLLREGMAARASLLRERARTLRKAFRRIGLRFLINETDMCSMLTTILIPDGHSVDSLRWHLRSRDSIIYGGKGPLAGRVFQIASIGELAEEDIFRLIGQLEEIFSKKAHREESVSSELLALHGHN